MIVKVKQVSNFHNIGRNDTYYNVYGVEYFTRRYSHGRSNGYLIYKVFDGVSYQIDDVKCLKDVKKAIAYNYGTSVMASAALENALWDINHS